MKKFLGGGERGGERRERQEALGSSHGGKEATLPYDGGGHGAERSHGAHQQVPF